MPVIEQKNVVEITAKAIFAIWLIALVICTFILFLNGYPSLAFVCLSLAGITGGIWLWISVGQIGAWVLVISVVVLLFDAWLGTPILEWKELIGYPV